MLTKEQIEALQKPIMSVKWWGELGSRTRAQNKMRKVCEHFNISTFYELVQIPEPVFIEQSGEACYRKVICALDRYGLWFGMPISGYKAHTQTSNTPLPIPSTEREVWISDLGAIKTDDNDVELTLSCPQRPHVLRKGFEFEECWNHCAWFRIKDGLAMCGAQIIGRIVEKPERKV